MPAQLLRFGEVCSVLTIRNRNAYLKSLPRDPDFVIRAYVPLRIQSLVRQVVIANCNCQFKVDRQRVESQITSLQSECHHPLYVQWEMTKKDVALGKWLTHGYTNICQICGFTESANVGKDPAGKPAYSFSSRRWRGQRMFVFRRGAWAIDILQRPMVEIIERALKEIERRRLMSMRYRKRA